VNQEGNLTMTQRDHCCPRFSQIEFSVLQRLNIARP
jgi:hypothetical protein